MTREQAKEFIIKNFGIEDPSQEQVSAFLNNLNGETQKERDRAEAFKADAKKAAELQEQIDKIEEEKMSELDKALKRAEEAEKLATQRATELVKTKIAAEFKTGGYEGETYDSIVNILSNLPEEEAINQSKALIAGWNKTRDDALAVLAAERDGLKTDLEAEKLKNMRDPDGTGSAPAPEQKSEAAEYAKAKSASYAAAKTVDAQAQNVSEGSAPVNF